MNNLRDERFAKFGRDAFSTRDEWDELDRDLWPQMQSRLQGSTIRLPWFDWVLAAVTVTICLLIPELFAGLIFHL